MWHSYVCLCLVQPTCRREVGLLIIHPNDTLADVCPIHKGSNDLTYLRNAQRQWRPAIYDRLYWI